MQGIRNALMIMGVAVFVLYLTACSGGKFCVSLNQIDEVSESQKLSSNK